VVYVLPEVHQNLMLTVEICLGHPRLFYQIVEIVFLPETQLMIPPELFSRQI